MFRRKNIVGTNTSGKYGICRLYLTDQEKKDFRYYMEKEGIDFARPVFLIGVTTKLLHKKWNTEFAGNHIDLEALGE